MIPADGEVVEGIASVDEFAITGESAPVIRESRRRPLGVTGGTRVVSDWIMVRITARAGRELPRPHDRAGRRRRAAEDAERDRAEHPAGRPDLIFLIVVATLAPFAAYAGATVPVDRLWSRCSSR